MVPEGISDVAAANDFLHSLGGMATIEHFNAIEDLSQIPYAEEMGEVNKTLLRCAESVFRIHPAEMNHLKVATMKQMREANKQMVQRNTLPVFSGNIGCYLANQLLEFELLTKVKNVMSKTDTNRAPLSSVYAYYTRLMAQANLQFAEPAA